jgi:hypothetical protein
MLRRSQLLLFAALCAFAHGAQPSGQAPAVNWVLPLFSKEGYRVMTLRGSEARPIEGNRLSVTNLNITAFSGDEAARVTTVLLSPEALYDPQTKLASGTRTVRVIRDDVEATGTSWTYDPAQKHVTLDGEVRIVLNFEIKNLLQ